LSTIRFEVRDAANIRFCISPLWETVRSLYALADPGRHVVHLPWMRQVRTLIGDPDLAGHLHLLSGFARPGAWLPDFLTPPPPGPLTDIEEELTAVRATPPETILADLAAIATKSPLTPPAMAALAEPELVLQRLVESTRVWHRIVIAPHWPRMQALLEADIAHRSRSLAEGGVHGLFNSLHPTIRWATDRIVSDDRWDLDLDLRGRGLPLMPSVFVDRRVLWNIRADSAPVAVYPARASATLWQTGPHASQALSAVVGITRAQLLTMLQAPATTTELARRVDLSAAAVSQHLQALHAAGLIGRSQHGRSVLYVATQAGITLLRASGQDDGTMSTPRPERKGSPGSS
jgi:DNA-binding transcriptional ArsR family regulator